MRRQTAARALAGFIALALYAVPAIRPQMSLPATTVVALDAHEVQLPRDLSETNVFIVGFSRASADATTAWEIPIRTHLAGARLGFYDVAVLASAPSFFRGWINRSLKKKVPQVLQPRFLPVYSEDAAWKAFSGFDSKAPDAAYIVVTDRRGKVMWQTHEPYTSSAFEELRMKTSL